MGKIQVLMISGDIGGAKAQLPVYKKLAKLGISVRVIIDADPKTKGGAVWEKENILFERMLPGMADFEDAIKEADLISFCLMTWAMS